MDFINRETSNKLLFNPESCKEKMAEVQQVLHNPTAFTPQQVIEAWAIIGRCYGLNQEPELAEEAYLKAFEIIKTLGDRLLLGKGYADLGFTLFLRNNYPRAIVYYQQAIEIFKSLNEVEELITGFSQIAYAYEWMEQRQEEREYLKLGLPYLEVYPVTLAAFLSRMAQSLDQSGHYEEAISTYERALTIFEAEQYFRGWEERVRELAEVYNKVGDTASAKRTLKRLETDIDEVLARLQDPVEYTRLAALAVLVEEAKVGAFDVIPILHQVIAQDPSDDVRELATIFLEQLSRPSTIDN